MNHKKYYNISEELLNRIIAVAYNDAGIIEKIKIKCLAAKDNEVKKALDEYSRTAAAVHNLEKDVCPEHLLNKVRKITETENNSSFVYDLFSIFVSKPLITSVATAAIVLIIVKSVVLPPSDYNGYSEAEIAKANKDIKASFALIGKVFNKTKNTIKDEVLTSRVGKPLNEGINFVNDLLIEEK